MPKLRSNLSPMTWHHPWRCWFFPTRLTWLPAVLPCDSLLLTRLLPHTHPLARGLKSFLCCFKGTSLNGENWFEHVFVLLSHLAAKRPVTRLWVTTMVLFENIMEWVFGAFMLLMTLYGETRSKGFHQTSARKLGFLAWNPIYLAW